MEVKPSPKADTEPSMDQQEAEASEVPSKKNPKEAAASLNPKERNAFYESVVQKRGQRRKN